MSKPNPEFVRAVTECQSRIYAYALSLLADPEAAADVLQETNLVLWEKADEFASIDNFPAYAIKIALNKTRNMRRKMQRDRLLFDDDVLDKLAAEADAIEPFKTERLAALSDCIERLPRHHRELIRRRYSQTTTVKQLAEAIGKPANSVRVMLFRIRETLVACVEGRVGEAKP
ncbi:MAG: sigma-70 family RNA polymerase sigma factor [Phycisphaeraceae bacterium]